ncbi:hypothetical protein P1P68_06060 [Streptomyces scabiei]|uniref:hypothetical protein n=1 Tax=Streptomyces scabiei TaxID=1930 RepID=UPI00298FFD9C|nr:hypothetical protein [Streptomyces scabiei]MDW8804367.1 hypothetical protein [Streptomyces scabiei]
MPAPDSTLAITPVHPTDPPRGPAQALHWVWPVNPLTEELVFSTVTEALTAWGYSEFLADQHGELAAWAAGSFRRCRYVAVAIGRADHVTVISVRSGHDLNARAAMHLGNDLTTAWGVRGAVGETDAYFVTRFALRIPRVDEDQAYPVGP